MGITTGTFINGAVATAAEPVHTFTQEYLNALKVAASPSVDPSIKSIVSNKNGTLTADYFKDGFFEYSSKLIPDIKDVRTYNDRVVVVEFIDGSEEKAVLHPDDKFSVEAGVSICIAKKLAGDSSVYNKLVDRALTKMKRNREEEARAEEETRKRAERKKVIAEKKAERKRKIEDRQIENMAIAMVRAFTKIMDMEKKLEN